MSESHTACWSSRAWCRLLFRGLSFEPMCHKKKNRYLKSVLAYMYSICMTPQGVNLNHIFCANRAETWTAPGALRSYYRVAAWQLRYPVFAPLHRRLRLSVPELEHFISASIEGLIVVFILSSFSRLHFPVRALSADQQRQFLSSVATSSTRSSTYGSNTSGGVFMDSCDTVAELRLCISQWSSIWCLPDGQTASSPGQPSLFTREWWICDLPRHALWGLCARSDIQRSVVCVSTVRERETVGGMLNLFYCSDGLVDMPVTIFIVSEYVCACMICAHVLKHTRTRMRTRTRTHTHTRARECVCVCACCHD